MNFGRKSMIGLSILLVLFVVGLSIGAQAGYVMAAPLTQDEPAAGEPDWSDEQYLAEYEQRAHDAYAVVQAESMPLVKDSSVEGCGESFIAECEEHARVKYAALQTTMKPSTSDTTLEGCGERFVEECEQHAREAYELYVGG